MKVIVAGNSRMISYIVYCISSIKQVGYPVVVFDLGGLGFGEQYFIDNHSFQTTGYYHKFDEKHSAPSIHKPELIKKFFVDSGEPFLYLDADIIMMKKVDELFGDFDIGLTVRPDWEMEKIIPFEVSPIYSGYINAGVMSFNNTPQTLSFIEEWEQMTEETGDDQKALNIMLKDYFPLIAGGTIERKGVKYRFFDTQRYNHYYFKYTEMHRKKNVTSKDIAVPWKEASILHFKGRARQDFDKILKLIKKEFYRDFS